VVDSTQGDKGDERKEQAVGRLVGVVLWINVLSNMILWWLVKEEHNQTMFS